MDAQETTIFMPVASAMPGEFGFHFRVPHANVTTLQPLVVNEDTYLSAIGKGLPNAERVEESLAGHAVKDFIFKGWQDGPEGHVTAMFHRKLTTKEMAMPLKSEKDTYSMERPWPNVLIYLAAIEDTQTTLTIQLNGEIVEVPRLFGRVYRVPEGSYSCTVHREVHVSHDGKFPPHLTQTNVPVPGMLQWDHRNLNGGLRCLHPRIVFEETQKGYRRLSNWGTVGKSPPSGGNRIIIPPTNHVTWERHCFDVNVQRTPDGQRVLTRLIAEPPDGFRAVRDMSAI